MVQDYSKNLIYGNFLGMDNRAFPIDCETLATLQSNAKKFAATALIAGCERLILTGCQQSGTVRKEGYVFIVNPDNPLTGEVLFHPEQPAKDHCHVKESPVDVTADGTDYPAAYTERSLEEGLVEGAWLWSSFTRIEDISNAALKDSLDTVNNALDQKIESLKNNAQYTFVRGMIMIWSGYISEIPSGWALCDGQNGTPDLRGRFIVGAGRDGANAVYYQTKTKNPEDPIRTVKFTLRAEDLPAHRHMYIGDSNAPGDDLTLIEGVDGRSGKGSGYGAKILTDSMIYAADSTHGVRQTSSTITTLIDVRPPYYALAYIMKL